MEKHMKKMRGAIDPWTLGFIISLFGGVTGLIVHPPGEKNLDESTIEEKIITSQDTIEVDKTTVIVSKR